MLQPLGSSQVCLKRVQIFAAKKKEKRKKERVQIPLLVRD
jgi:hypothetical protein